LSAGFQHILLCKRQISGNSPVPWCWADVIF
jgi:hypothetical protein